MVIGTDVPIVKAQGDVTADMLTQDRPGRGLRRDRLGHRRRARAPEEPVGKGGWNVFHTWHAGVDCVNPGAQPAYYTTRRQGLVRLAEIR